MNIEQTLKKFLAEQYPQIECEKCAMTFLTNVYDFDDEHVLLEKRSYGLEYYCGAIHDEYLVKVPKIYRIGIVDEEDNLVETPSKETIYSGEETDLRFIYVMEKLQHLNKEDSDYFDENVKNLEWENKTDQEKIIEHITDRYNSELAQDIAKLYKHYKIHEGVLAWDLHGDNLMQRKDTDEIVILDPYTRKA